MTEKELELGAPRGTRDFSPEEKILLDRVESVLKRTFEKYGFVPLDTPALENFSTLSSKFAGGEEILKETYSLVDQGGRKLGLRYDLTVPLCRYVASNPKIPKLFKRYQIASVWRDGPIKLGRYREFRQADVDTVGVEGMLAEAEIIALACDAFKELGLNACIKVNNRKLLWGLMENEVGLKKEKVLDAIISVDKLDKIGENGVLQELEQKGLDGKSAKKLLDSLKLDLRALEKKNLGKEGARGLEELKELLELLEEYGVEKQVVFTPSLARGLNYYTGTIFEAFLREWGITSAIAAGGRYDDLIGKFMGAKEKIPAVGISFGLDVLCDAINSLDKKCFKKTSLTQVYLISINSGKEAIKIAQALRALGLAVGMDLLARGVSKGLEYASKQGIPFAAIIGDKELKQKKITLRNLVSGEEKLVSLNEAVEIVRRG
jgi:histidyl-tRNA synthetase